MPTLVFAKQFLDDFAKLQPVVRQKVRELPDKFEHSATTGVHLEKLNASRDDRVRTVRVDELPAGRTVVHFRFPRAAAKVRYFWLVLPDADLCLSDPGFGVDVTVTSDPKTLTAVWMGDVAVATAVRAGSIELDGTRQLVRSFANWFGLHPLFSTVEHPAAHPRVAAR